jgi:hypothetical protein
LEISNTRIIVGIGADPLIKLHRYCKRNWINYFDYIDFKDFYFVSRSLESDSDKYLDNEIVYSLSKEIRDSISFSINKSNEYHNDWSGDFGKSVLMTSIKFYRFLIDSNPEDFVLYTPTATSAIDIEQIKIYIENCYSPHSNFYGGAPIPIVHRPSSDVFWYVSGSGMMMSKSTLALLCARLESAPVLTDDLLYGILLSDHPRYVITRKSLSVTRSIHHEYDEIFRKVDEYRKHGCFCFRLNSSWSEKLEGGRDENDSILQGIAFNVLLKHRNLPVMYSDNDFRVICKQLGFDFCPPTLSSGHFYGGDSVVIAGF